MHAGGLVCVYRISWKLGYLYRPEPYNSISILITPLQLLLLLRYLDIQLEHFSSSSCMPSFPYFIGEGECVSISLDLEPLLLHSSNMYFQHILAMSQKLFTWNEMYCWGGKRGFVASIHYMTHTHTSPSESLQSFPSTSLISPDLFPTKLQVPIQTCGHGPKRWIKTEMIHIIKYKISAFTISNSRFKISPDSNSYLSPPSSQLLRTSLDK